MVLCWLAYRVTSSEFVRTLAIVNLLLPEIEQNLLVEQYRSVVSCVYCFPMLTCTCAEFLARILLIGLHSRKKSTKVLPRFCVSYGFVFAVHTARDQFAATRAVPEVCQTTFKQHTPSPTQIDNNTHRLLTKRRRRPVTSRRCSIALASVATHTGFCLGLRCHVNCGYCAELKSNRSSETSTGNATGLSFAF